MSKGWLFASPLLALAGSLRAAPQGGACEHLYGTLMPCAFYCTSGTPGETLYKKPPQYVCDYLQVNWDNGMDAFNHLPDLQAQKKALADWTKRADVAYDDYRSCVKDFLNDTAPSQAKRLSEHGYGRKLDSDQKEIEAMPACAEPFVGKQVAARYIAGADSPYENTWNWKGYFTDFEARRDVIARELDANAAEVLDLEREDVKDRIAAAAKLQANGSDQDSKTLEGLYNGGKPSESPSPVSIEAPASADSARISATNTQKKAAPAARVPYPESTPKSIADTLSSVLPTTPEEIAQRRYFARGYAAGWERINDDVTVAVWHGTGETATVGDPYGKAKLVFAQKDGTCAIASTQQLMAAHGVHVSMEDLTVTARELGLLDPHPETPGEQGGQPIGAIGLAAMQYGDLKLVARNDVLSPKEIAKGASLTAVTDALFTEYWYVHVFKSVFGDSAAEEARAQRQLDAAIREHQGAVVPLEAAIIWPGAHFVGHPDHAVYVTGEEVTPDGQIRGYYINDSGSGEGARYVDSKTFLMAWRTSYHQMAAIESGKAPDLSKGRLPTKPRPEEAD